MIIFGYRGFAKLLGIVSLVCGRCGNPAAHQLVRRSRWFTLFFIPVIPLHFSHTITCTYCGCQTKVSRADAESMLATAAGSPAAVPQGAQQAVQQGYPQQSYPQGHPQPQPGYPQQQYPHQPPHQPS